MLVNTGWALVTNFLEFQKQYRIAIDKSLSGTPSLVNMIVALILFCLGLFVVFEAIRVWYLDRLSRSSQN
jgi:hypothetical protein